MERLTYRDCTGVACFRWENPRGTTVIANEAISRLAAYEDLGRTPEELAAELAELERLRDAERWIQDYELEIGPEDNDEIPFIVCSGCSHKEWHYDLSCEDVQAPNYCPHCGAKMVKEASNNA